MPAQPVLKREDFIAGLIGMAVFMLIGAGLLAASLIIYRGTRKFLAHAVETTGVVVGFDRLHTRPETGGEEIPLVPVVKYTPEGGEPQVVKARTRSAWGNYEYGQEVKVFYDPARPGEARLATGTELWFGPLLLLLVGLGALFVPPFTIWRYLRSRPHPNNGDA